MTDAPTLRLRFCIELPIGCDVPILCGVLRVRKVVPLLTFPSWLRRCRGAVQRSNVIEYIHLSAFVASVGIEVTSHCIFTDLDTTVSVIVGVIVGDNNQRDGWPGGCRNYLNFGAVRSASWWLRRRRHCITHCGVTSCASSYSAVNNGRWYAGSAGSIRYIVNRHRLGRQRYG